MGPLTALTEAFHREVRWTHERPFLGLPGCERHTFDASSLPAPEVAEFSSKTKDPAVLCVEYIKDGVKAVRPILGPCSQPRASDISQDLVRKGIHPLDIIMARWNSETGEWTFKNTVDLLIWSCRDQNRLEIEVACKNQ